VAAADDAVIGQNILAGKFAGVVRRCGPSGSLWSRTWSCSPGPPFIHGHPQILAESQPLLLLGCAGLYLKPEQTDHGSRHITWSIAASGSSCRWCIRAGTAG
jgi:hypothetical protein